MRRPCGWAQAAATPWEGCWHHSVRRMGAPLLRTAGAAMLRMHGPGIEKGRIQGSRRAPDRRGAEGSRKGGAKRGLCSSHGEGPGSDCADPIRLLEEQAETRVQDLVPIRYGRMSASPFAFFRGAAYVMASDLADTPSTGLRVQLCGDAHLSNFGAFAGPARRLVFDLNDFDETLPGPWEWDVKRLAASLVVAARQRSCEHASSGVVAEAVQRYREGHAAVRGDAQPGGVVLADRRRVEVRRDARPARSGHADEHGATWPRRGARTACARSRSSRAWRTASRA